MFMESDAHESKIDVRIIVAGLDIAQLVSKAVNNIQLENDYNIIVSSIIPTVELSIVKKVASGADILLIGSYGHDETYNILFNELKTDFNHIGLFDYNNIIIEDESIDFRLAEKEILNSIIKANENVKTDEKLTSKQLKRITDSVVAFCETLEEPIDIDILEDVIEKKIMEAAGYEVAKKYITYIN
jgi:predicted nuclease with TOPRIM domain